MDERVMFGNDGDSGPSFAEVDGQRYYLGCILPEEERAPGYLSWAEAGKPRIPRGEWRSRRDQGVPHWRPAIYDQGRTNSCTGNGFAGAFGSAWAKSGRKAQRFSPWYIYALVNGGRDQGAQCRDVVEAAKRGMCPLEVSGDRLLYPSQISQAMREAATANLLLEAYQCLDFDDMGSAITAGYEVYFGLCLGQAFFRTGSNGLVPEYDGQRQAGHAMYADDLRLDLPTPHLVVPNSWGAGFGEAGVGYMPESYFWLRSGNFVNLDAWAIRCVTAAAEDGPTAKES